MDSLVLSGDFSTLYYGSPALGNSGSDSGVIGGAIYSLQVNAGIVKNSANPTTVLGSNAGGITLIYPDSLLFNSQQDILYIKDGGAYQGKAPYDPLGPPTQQSIYAYYPYLGVVQTLYNSSQINLPSGLAQSTDFKTLYFNARISTTATAGSNYLDQLTLPTPLQTQFSSAVKGDEVGCLSSYSMSSGAYAASFGGNIYQFPLSPPPVSIAPVFSVPGAYYVACAAQRNGAMLYLLDTQAQTLSVYNSASNTVNPVASFPMESAGYLTLLAVDWSANVAYVGTKSSAQIYSVNLDEGGSGYDADDSYTVNSDVDSLVLSGDFSTLYYGSPALGNSGSDSGVIGGAIYSLQVNAGIVKNSANPTTVLGSNAGGITLIYPDSLLFNSQQDILYIKDGGAYQGKTPYDPLGPPTEQSIYALYLYTNGVVQTLYNTSSVNLPSGLALSNSLSTLFYTARVSTSASAGVNYLEQVIVLPTPPPVPSSSAVSSSAVSSSARSSSALSSSAVSSSAVSSSAVSSSASPSSASPSSAAASSAAASSSAAEPSSSVAQAVSSSKSQKFHTSSSSRQSVTSSSKPQPSSSPSTRAAAASSCPAALSTPLPAASR